MAFQISWVGLYPPADSIFSDSCYSSLVSLIKKIRGSRRTDVSYLDLENRRNRITLEDCIDRSFSGNKRDTKINI